MGKSQSPGMMIGNRSSCLRLSTASPNPFLFLPTWSPRWRPSSRAIRNSARWARERAPRSADEHPQYNKQQITSSHRRTTSARRWKLVRPPQRRLPIKYSPTPRLGRPSAMTSSSRLSRGNHSISRVQQHLPENSKPSWIRSSPPAPKSVSTCLIKIQPKVAFSVRTRIPTVSPPLDPLASPNDPN